MALFSVIPERPHRVLFLCPQKGDGFRAKTEKI
nr:MAG TPA: hypothetical protein [Caudoviricetes sp.]